MLTISASIFLIPMEMDEYSTAWRDRRRTGKDVGMERVGNDEFGGGVHDDIVDIFPALYTNQLPNTIRRAIPT